MRIPSMLLKQLYTFGSLHNTDKGVVFTVKNRLTDVTLTALHGVQIDGKAVPQDKIVMEVDDENKTKLTPAKLQKKPFAFPLGQSINMVLGIEPLSADKHKIQIEFETKEYGRLKVTVDDAISEIDKDAIHIPRDSVDDYSRKIIKARQKFLMDISGTKPKHIFKYSFDPHITKGNIENFTGVAQVPIGFAGPLRIITRHVWPLCISSLVIRVTLDMAGIILTAAGLGFLGLGAQPPLPEWGAMIATGRRYMIDSWWLVTFPGLAILSVSLAFNLLGDGLRDALDPKQMNRR